MKDSKAVLTCSLDFKRRWRLWPWGFIIRWFIFHLYDRYQKLEQVSGIDLVAGMGLALGMKSIKPSLATGYENTDLVQKLEVAFNSRSGCFNCAY